MEQGRKKREGKEMEFQPSNLPILCAANCGFFGNSSTSNLCSKCYHDALLTKSKGAIDAISAPGAAEAEVKDAGMGSADGAMKGEDDAGVMLGKRPANRCNFCNKRVGLMGFKCRCGDVFCSLHLYGDKHNCIFDYKGAGHEAIAKANPIVKADKVDKI